MFERLHALVEQTPPEHLVMWFALILGTALTLTLVAVLNMKKPDNYNPWDPE